ncbi:cation diffusion facilitator family transporter [Planctomycetota bacterium]
MNSVKLETTGRQIKSVTYTGIVINICLSILKLIVGFLVGSLALIADGMHSFSDLATDAMVLIGIWLGSKKADSSHPYGHGRAETLAGVIIAVVLIVVGGAMIRYAAISIAKDVIATANIWIAVVAVASIISKEFLYKISLKVAIKSHSPSLYANAWHHRSDALSSVAVAIGFISLKFGFDHGDQVAAIAVGLMIIWVGVKVSSDALQELTEGAIDGETVKQIEKIIDSDSQVRHWHKLRTRTVGREVFLDVHILVDHESNVAAAHEVSENLEKSLHEQIVRPINITIHIEPDIPEMRK